MKERLALPQYISSYCLFSRKKYTVSHFVIQSLLLLTKLHKADAKYLPLFERRLKCQQQQQQQKDGSSLFLVGNDYAYPDFRLWELLEEN